MEIWKSFLLLLDFSFKNQEIRDVIILKFIESASLNKNYWVNEARITESYLSNAQDIANIYCFWDTKTQPGTHWRTMEIYEYKTLNFCSWVKADKILKILQIYYLFYLEI